MRGVEACFKYNLSERLSFSANYTFSESTIRRDEANPAVQGNDLPFTPHNKVNIGIIGEMPDLFSFLANWRYVGKMFSDVENRDRLSDYSVFDIRLLRGIGPNTEVSLGMENLFDEEYDVPNMAGEDLKAPGRMIIGALNLKW